MEVLKRKVNESWCSILPIHPAAGLFPLMSPDELRALGEDIRKHGLRLPCSLVEDEYGDVALFDGRNRLDALELIGKEITLDNSIIFERFPADSIDVTERVVSLNIHRRHLTAEQKRDLVAKLIKADPSKSDRQIAETVKASPTTVGTVRAKMEAKGDVSNLDTRRDTKGRQQPAHRTTSAPSEAKTHKIKFTPERIAQIKNLVERGISREEIAEIIGVTTSSLQTTCSRLGISLRRKARTTPTPPPPEDTRDDVGPASTSEVARPQSRVSELQAEKRGLEIENVGLRSEVQDAKAERKPELAPDGETAFYCSFCGKSQHDVDTLITDGGRLKPVCICNECVDLCVNIIKDRSSAAHEEAAAPPVSGDYPDIPESLRRAAP